MEPLTIVLIAAGVSSAFCWITSLITRETSWVDRLWSIVPVVYVWIIAGAAGLGDLRLNVMAILVTLWGARLTFNFARRGGYSGIEDYRWAILRGRMTRLQFELFNIGFIVIFQQALLVLITLPALVAYEHRTAMGPLDWLLAALFLAFLVGETIADQQQWRFQQAKAAEIAAGREPEHRFAQTGLWRYSRHPNFFFEQAQWWVFFLMGAVAAGTLFQWSVVGAALLTILFVGSTIFTESITRSKYPEYADYQATTSAIIPFPPRVRRARAAG